MSSYDVVRYDCTVCDYTCPRLVRDTVPDCVKCMAKGGAKGDYLRMVQRVKR